MRKDSIIFVAGHKGTAGSAILEKLKSQGFENIITKTHAELDLCDQGAVEEFFAKFKPEFIFLCAVLPCGAANVAQRADFLWENLMMNLNVIHATFKFKAQKLVCYGSGYMYPENAKNPLKESDLFSGELEWNAASFATAKIAVALLCESYNIQYGTNFLCLALNNLYGSKANFDLGKSRFLPALVRKFHLAKLLSEKKFDAVLKDLKMSDEKEALEYLNKFGVSAESVEIWGSGKVRREFLHSQDLADASIFAMQNIDFKDLAAREEKPKNTHINIGTGVDYTIKEVALLVREIIGFKGELVFNTARFDSSMDRLMDISKIRSLGWEPKIDLKKGIKMMYEEYLKAKFKNF